MSKSVAVEEPIWVGLETWRVGVRFTPEQANALRQRAGGIIEHGDGSLAVERRSCKGRPALVYRVMVAGAILAGFVAEAEDDGGLLVRRVLWRRGGCEADAWGLVEALAGGSVPESARALAGV